MSYTRGSLKGIQAESSAYPEDGGTVRVEMALLLLFIHLIGYTIKTKIHF
jgi:hypothetical protein